MNRKKTYFVKYRINHFVNSKNSHFMKTNKSQTYCKISLNIHNLGPLSVNLLFYSKGHQENGLLIIYIINI